MIRLASTQANELIVSLFPHRLVIPVDVKRLAVPVGQHVLVQCLQLCYQVVLLRWLDANRNLLPLQHLIVLEGQITHPQRAQLANASLKPLAQRTKLANASPKPLTPSASPLPWAKARDP